MPISFPSNPALNQTFTTSDGNFYRYNGKGWVRTSPNFSCIAAGSITGNLIANLTIESVELANGAVTTEKLNLANGYLQLPAGTYDQRPVTPANGIVRFNTSNNWLEVYMNGGWNCINTTNLSPYGIDLLVIAGGGAGASGFASWAAGGGGGAGGMVCGTISNVIPSLNYTIVVGAGGAGVNGVQLTNKGSNSCLSFFIAEAGGAGGYWNSSGSGVPTELRGGSGGGGANSSGCTAGGSGISGQGNPGGAGVGYTGNSSSGAGGGGGAGGPGGNGSSGPGGCGGLGVANTITGSSVTYASGGGGGGSSGGSVNPGGGGAGGGTGGSGTSGTTNTGGGGGGGGTVQPGTTASGSGGSGIVILRYLGPQKGSGGTITSANGYTIHTFTSSGTYTA